MSALAPDDRFYYSRLSPENRRIYRAVLDQWSAGSGAAVLSLPGPGFPACHGLKLHDVVSCILLDNPQLFHLNRWEIAYRRSESCRVELSAGPLYTPEEYDTLSQKLLTRVGNILSQPELFEQPEACLRFLHDSLSGSVVPVQGGHAAPDGRDTRIRWEAHTIVGALLNQACVCEGFAHAFRLLCGLVRIPCMVVNGAVGRGGVRELHVWNLVWLDGQTFHVDTAWDCAPSPDGQVPIEYYLRGDDAFAATHNWDRSFYPPCPLDHPVWGRNRAQERREEFL